MMGRQRLINEHTTFEDLVRANLNGEQVDSLIEHPQWTAGVKDMNKFLE